MTEPEQRDSRSQAMYWASRGMSVGLEFVVPALLGLGLDRVWPLAPAGVIGGAVLGFAVGLYHLLQIAAEGERRFPPKKR